MATNIGHHWLLLRGLSREHAHWGEFILQLQAAFPQACLHTLDLPGTGEYHRHTCPATIEAITELSRNRAAQLGWLDQPVTLLGLSLGGMVVWQWLKNYPKDACAGVLINSSFAHLSPFYQRLRWQNYLRLTHLLCQTSAKTQERHILNLVSNLSPAQTEIIAAQWEEIRGLRPVSALSTLHQLQAASRFRPDEIPPEHPLLLINSEGDRLVAPICSEAISRQYDLPLKTHPHAGHDLPLDAGAWLIGVLTEWSQSFGAQTRSLK